MDGQVSGGPERGVILGPYQAMELAIAEARKGAPFVSPNPRVGCVILDRTGRLLSWGHHERCGGPHAEINALQGLTSSDLEGARVFVTLEPCAHEGRTPSCAKHLAGLPIESVVFGLEDPNPLVAGRGKEILRAAGKACDVFHLLHGTDLDDELEEVAEHFLWNFRHHRPFVSLKTAVSLDGRIASASGQSQWITGTESRRHVHHLRAAVDGVLVGVGTFLADDPGLDIRDLGFEKENFALVLDPSGRGAAALAGAKIRRVRAPEKVIWLVATDAQTIPALRALGVSVLEITTLPEGKGLDLRAVLSCLWDFGLRSVLVEGGGRTAGAFLAAEAIQRLHLFQAPVILGGDGAPGWSGEFRVSDLRQAPKLHRSRTLVLGADLYLTGLLQDPQSGVSYRNV